MLSQPKVFSPPKGELLDSPPLMLSDFGSPRDYTHSLFRFPGRFHPPLVAYLMSLHPEAETVGDPMVGSGTVAVEAAAAGKIGIFSDIDPLSCLIARAKSRPVNPNWLDQTVGKVMEKAKPVSKKPAKQSEASASVRELEASTEFRAPPNLRHWFQSHVTINFCRCLGAISDLNLEGEERDAVLAVVAAMIRKVSRADPNTSSGLEVTKFMTRKIKNGLAFDFYREFERKAKLLSDGYRELLAAEHLGDTLVVQRDVKEWTSTCRESGRWPDLVVTSPCYMSAIEYWRRHKLEYCWLGLVAPEKLAEVRSGFLGMGRQEPDLDSLPSYVRDIHKALCDKGRKQGATLLARYFEDSALWLKELDLALSHTDGVAYIVVAGNTSHGVVLDTPRALLEISSSLGLPASKFKEYGLKNSYMQYQTSTERIKTETIIKVSSS